MGISLLALFDFKTLIIDIFWSPVYYMICLLFLLLDWLQGIVRSMSGLEPMKIDGKLVNADPDGASYDLMYYLTRTDVIVDAFFSMLIFSMILLIIMTVLAIIRNTYQDKQKPVMDIIMKSFKALLGFLLVPIACIVGIMFSNVLLQAIDGATSAGNAPTTMSSNLFLSGAYDSNWLRTNDIGKRQKALRELVDDTNFETYPEVVKSGLIPAGGDVSGISVERYATLATCLDHAMGEGYLKWNNGNVINQYTYFSVSIAYDVSSMNYLVFAVGGCTLIAAFYKMCWGMMSRILKLCFDFVLIPVVLAMMPFDDGKALGSWKGDFVKNMTMAYGVIGALNLYYSILPVIDSISFGTNTGFFSFIYRLLMQIVGVYSVNGLISTVNGWFGTGDLLAEGANAAKSFSNLTSKVSGGIKKVGGAYGGMMAGIKSSKDLGKGGFGRVKGALRGIAGGTGLDKKLNDFSVKRSIAAGRKGGKSNYYEAETTKFDWGLKTDKSDSAKARTDLAMIKGKYAKTMDGMTDKEKTEFIYNTPEMQAIIKNGGIAEDGEAYAKKQREIQSNEKIVKDNQEYTAPVADFFKADEAKSRAKESALAALSNEAAQYKNGKGENVDLVKNGELERMINNYIKDGTADPKLAAFSGFSSVVATLDRAREEQSNMESLASPVITAMANSGRYEMGDKIGQLDLEKTDIEEVIEMIKAAQAASYDKDGKVTGYNVSSADDVKSAVEEMKKAAIRVQEQTKSMKDEVEKTYNAALSDANASALSKMNKS